MIPIYQNTDFPERELYEHALKKQVCSRCIDFGEDGKCHGLDPEGCAIFRYLPELVSIAKSLDFDLKSEPYMDAVRSKICLKCPHQTSAKCDLRDAIDCGLDRYLLLAIGAIEEVQERII